MTECKMKMRLVDEIMIQLETVSSLEITRRFFRSLGDRRTKLGRACFTECGENPGKSVLPVSEIRLMFPGCLSTPERRHTNWFATLPAGE